MSKHPPFAVAVDLAIFTIRDGALSVLLVERARSRTPGSGPSRRLRRAGRGRRAGGLA